MIAKTTPIIKKRILSNVILELFLPSTVIGAMMSAVPAELLATTLYSPSWSIEARFIVSVHLSPSYNTLMFGDWVISLLSLSHVTSGRGSPVTRQVRVMGLSSITVHDSKVSVNSGACDVSWWRSTNGDSDSLLSRPISVW